MERGLMLRVTESKGFRRRKTKSPIVTFNAAVMNSTYLTVETILREAELDESYTTNPPNTRVNSPLSLPVGVHDHFQIEAVLQGYYPSMPAPPTNTRDCSPSRDASVHSIQPHTTGQVIETMSRLDQLADERE